MKKIVIIVILLAIAAGGWFFLKKKNGGNGEEAAEVKIMEVTRGTLLKSVEASGVVTSNLDVEIKCKASGEIINLPFEESDEVTKGTLVMELDPVDEERNVKQAEVSLLSSKAKLEQAKQNLVIAEQDLVNAKERARITLETAKVKAEESEAKAARVEELYSKKLASKEDLDSARTTAVQSVADLDKAKISIEELKTDEAGLDLKRQDVTLAKANLETAQISLDVARQRLQETKVYAPIDGVITQRDVQEGQIITSATGNVSGGSTVMLISDLSKLFIEASVDESDIGNIMKGQQVIITADAFPEAELPGVVERIAPKGKSVSNVVTFEVRIEVLKSGSEGSLAGMRKNRGNRGKRGEGMGDPEKMKEMFEQRMREQGMSEEEIAERRQQFEQKMKEGGGRPPMMGDGGGVTSPPAESETQSVNLKPQMTADVEIIIESAENAIQVPVDAITQNDGKSVVTVVTGEGKTEQREVETGLTDGVSIEIKSGLEEGDKVQVVRGGGASRWSNSGEGLSGRDARRTMGMMGGGPPPGR